jgi:hypothetical protein
MDLRSLESIELQPLRKGEFESAQDDLDDAETPENTIKYINVLCRSDKYNDVASGLNFISLLENSAHANALAEQILIYKIIILFRLKRDNECKELVKKAQDIGIKSVSVNKIRKIYKDEKDITAAAIGAGAATIAAGAILGLVFGLKGRKK